MKTNLPLFRKNKTGRAVSPRPPQRKGSSASSSFGALSERALPDHGRCLLLFLISYFFFLISPLHAAPDDWRENYSPYRVKVRAGKDTPDDKAIGWAIAVPDFGAMSSDGRDAVLLDQRGRELPLDFVARGEGREALFLARDLPENEPAWLYFGGRGRRNTGWRAEPSLLVETRRAPEKMNADTWQGLLDAWRNAPATDGAVFVPRIFFGENPCGASQHFLSRFTGLLRVPKAGKLRLYSLSANQAYVFVEGRPVIEWKQNAASPRDPRTMPQATIDVPGGVVRIDYYHAINQGEYPGMVLGWEQDGKLDTIPGEAWLHPGKTRLGKIERKDGGVVPLAHVRAATYLGFERQWYIEAVASIDVPDDVSVAWRWPDGKITTGAQSSRVLFDLHPGQVQVSLNGGREGTGTRVLAVPRQMKTASVNNRDDLQRYLGLLDAEDASTLSEPARKAAFLLTRNLAPPATAARWAETWLAVATNFDDPWRTAKITALRWQARTHPRQALDALRALPPDARQRLGGAYQQLRLDFLVFGLLDPSVPGVVQRLLDSRPDSRIAQLARIRLGDYHRLLGQEKEARDAYHSAMETTLETLRKGPTQDKAFALALEQLVRHGTREEVRQKLAEWERARPIAKLDADFLLWNARLLALEENWPAALAELRSSLKIRPASPEEIEVRFWEARALFETGKKEEARQIWKKLAEDYPKNDLAPACKEWSEKP